MPSYFVHDIGTCVCVCVFACVRKNSSSLIGAHLSKPHYRRSDSKILNCLLDMSSLIWLKAV